MLDSKEINNLIKYGYESDHLYFKATQYKNKEK